MSQQKLDINLLRISKNFDNSFSHCFELMTFVDGEVKLYTVHNDTHLFSAILDHMSLLKLRVENPEMKYTNYPYYKIHIPKYVIEKIQSRDFSEDAFQYIYNQILLGEDQYKALTHDLDDT